MFIGVSHPDEIKDRKTRKKIQRHVMEDIGASRQRKPRKEEVLLATTWDDSTLLKSNSRPSPNPDLNLQPPGYSMRARKLVSFRKANKTVALMLTSDHLQ